MIRNEFGARLDFNSETGYTAPINKILPHSLVDGPGNRMAIFVQRCNIACRYCHNPETQALCCHCGVCVNVCPAGALSLAAETVVWQETQCIGCDACISICPHNSSPKVTELSAEAVFEEVQKNLPFIRGITVSGGECSLYPDFLRELFAKCQSIGLTCLMDCNGTLPIWNHPVMEVCDGVMLDVKAWSDKQFLALTGAHNRVVKENLAELARMDKLAELRIVCLEEWVDAEAALQGMEAYLPEAVRAETLLKLIRFRSVGVKGELAGARGPSADYMLELKALAKLCGFKKVRIV